MNLDELVRAARAALGDEYTDYDPAPGRARLEDDAVSDAVTGPALLDAAPPTTAPEPARRRSSGWVTEWSAQAACRTSDPDELFAQGAAQNRAKTVCTACPVRTECLADALDNRVEFGVWGGMTERERRALLQRRPTVVSWRKLLESARMEYERGIGIEPLDDGDLGSILGQAM